MATSPVHRLVDAGGAKYVPFAEAQLTMLRRALGGADYARVLKHGGYTISLRRSGGQEFIHIEGSQLFEFYTSGWPVTTTTMTQGMTTAQAYDAAIVSARVSGRSFSASFVGNKRLSYGAGMQDALTFGRHNWQIQLGQTPHVDVIELGKDKRKFKFTLSHVNPPTTGHTFAHVLTPFWSGYEGNFIGWINNPSTTPNPWNFATRDYGYDVLNWRMPGNDQRGGVTEALAQDSDWPRFWGIQEVSAAGKTLQFGIYVDAQGGWYAFPLAAMGNIAAGPDGVPIPNLTSANCRKVMPTYPSWVWRGDAETDKLKDLVGSSSGVATVNVSARAPEFRWEFNHSATKAATIAYARVDFGAFNNSWYTKPTPESSEALTPAEYDAACYFNNPWPVPSGMSPFSGGLGNAYEGWSGLPRNFAGPGVIEALPVITMNEGNDPYDFSFTVTINTVINPKTDAADFPLAVGYLWHLPDGEQSVAVGDMLVLEAAMYSYLYSYTQQMRLRNATSGAMVFTGMLGRVRGMDLRTLSFFIQSMMTSEAGPAQTATLGDYYAGQPVPSGYALTFTESFVTARPVSYAVVKGKLARVFLPDDVPTELAATAATVAAYTLDDVFNRPYSPPAGSVAMKLNTQWLPAMLRGGDAKDQAPEVAWFGVAVGIALKWANPPAGMSGYPVGWMSAALAVHNFLSIPGVDSTFYVHPNGSWAVFDAGTLYNTLGVPKHVSTMGRRYNTGALLQTTHFKWFVVDAVEIKRLGATKAAKSTFVELYNKAQAKHAQGRVAAGSAPDFQPLVMDDVLPTFTLHTQYVQNFFAGVDRGDLGTNEFTLGIHWSDGTVLYRRLPAYHTGGMLFPDPDMFQRQQDWLGWCLMGDAGDMMFQDVACTQIYPLGGMFERYTFRISSPRLIASPKGGSA